MMPPEYMPFSFHCRFRMPSCFHEAKRYVTLLPRKHESCIARARFRYYRKSNMVRHGSSQARFLINYATARARYSVLTGDRRTRAPPAAGLYRVLPGGRPIFCARHHPHWVKGFTKPTIAYVINRWREHDFRDITCFFFTLERRRNMPTGG